jgi:cation-transporting ATPase 13A1
MTVDFVGCWVVEVLCKHFFADLEPKKMITKGKERREQRRLQECALPKTIEDVEKKD